MPIQTLFVVVLFYTLLGFVPVAAFVLWRWPKAWAFLFALHLGLLVALIDLRSDDPQLAVVLLVTFGLFIGFAQPAGMWRWALALGLGVPFLRFFARALGVIMTPISDLLFSLVAFVPAFIGAYGGALVHKFSAQSKTP